jgi:hypothetical protein
MTPDDAGKYIDFFKKHAAAFIILLVLLTPTFWLVFEKIYSTKIQMYQDEVELLKSRVTKLQEKTTGFKEIITRETAGIDWENIKSN